MGGKSAEQVQRAYGLLDFLETHPESHDQSTWCTLGPRSIGWPIAREEALEPGCGTTLCAAGWTVLLAGGRMVGAQQGEVPGMGRRLVDTAAADLLGLTSGEARDLFYDSGDLPDVRKAIFDIFGPRPDGA